jgi:hypothetical protein
MRPYALFLAVLFDAAKSALDGKPSDCSEITGYRESWRCAGRRITLVNRDLWGSDVIDLRDVFKPARWARRSIVRREAPWCCIRHGVRYRSEPTGAWQRATMRTPKLIAMLDAPQRLRLKASPMRAKLERRERREVALRRNLLILRRYGLAAREKEMGKTKG